MPMPVFIVRPMLWTFLPLLFALGFVGGLLFLWYVD
jgi:hypothetical protein